MRAPLARWPFDRWSGIGPALAFTGLLLLGSLGAPRELIVLVLVINGGGLVLFLVGRALWLRYGPGGGHAGMLAVHAQGFVVEGRISLTARWDDFDDVRFFEREWYLNGQPHGRLRKLVLRRAEERIVLPAVLRYGAVDDRSEPAFAEVVRRIANQRLGSGRAIVGRRWMLSGEVIAVKAKRATLAEITAAQRIDGRVRLWTAQSAEPWLDVPAGSANACILVELATRDPKLGSAVGGGRVLFERRLKGAKWSAVILALGGAAGMWFAASNVAGETNAEVRLGYWLVGAGGLVLFMLAWAFLRQRVTVYDDAVRVQGLLLRRTIGFEQVLAFSYWAVLRTEHRAHVGTEHCFRLRCSGRSLKFVVTSETKDDALLGLRDRLAEVLAERALVRLSVEPFQWSDGVHLFADRVQLRRKRLLKKSPAEDVRFDQLQAVADGRTLSLTLAGDPKPAISIPMTAENFFVGAKLLERLVASQGSGVSRRV